MLELTRQEKNAAIFLLAIFILGLGTMHFKKILCRPSQDRVSSSRVEDVFSSGGIIDINRASRAELTRLRGVGEVLAGAIIEYRTQHGRFTAKEEIKAVKGIGRVKFEKIKGHIKI